MMAKKNNSFAAGIIGIVKEGTKKWARTVQMEERNPASRRYRYQRMTRERGIKFKEAAWEIMEQAYNKASGSGQYPALARQIMYAARPHIQKKVGKPLDSKYFTQVLLPDYIEAHPECRRWLTAYDARGHLVEPHRGNVINLGTNEVRDYLRKLRDPKLIGSAFAAANIDFHGPKDNFGGLLFIEKEGFGPLIHRAAIPDCFDIAVMSTKGMSVTAARELADRICFQFDIPLLTLTDFDKTGFSISGTLQRDTRRYEFQNEIEVIELGLSLEDVEELGLIGQFEHQVVGKASKSKMIDNGASQAEVEFMFTDWEQHKCLRRIELNALTSPQMVRFIEDKLEENGIEKIMPSAERLIEAYRLFDRDAKVQKVVEEAIKNIPKDDDVAVPDDLEDRVRDYLELHPVVRWDEAVKRVVDGKDDEPEPPLQPPPEPEPPSGPELKTTVKTFNTDEELFDFVISGLADQKSLKQRDG
jgi:hypothetical protein